MKTVKSFLTYLCLIISITTIAQNYNDVVEPDNFKTIILRPLEPNNYAPIIKLNESFIFSFDDLKASQQDYYYKIEHFTYDWKPSELSSREYIKGYDEDRFRYFENSLNTIQFYTHYSVTFPNRNTRILISGNYKISVLNDDDEILFTRRFVIYEPKVDVGVTVHRSRDISTINEQQSVQFIINHPSLLINNPKQEIKTVLMQNNDWNNAITNLQPQYYRGNQMIYKYTDKMNFWAGNEFYNFDSKVLRSPTVNIARVETGGDVFNTVLYTNVERIYQPYTYYPDINGAFVIRNTEGQNPTIDADYTLVKFSLEALEDMTGKKVYVYGSFNNWKLNESNQMIYNPETRLYEADILLKQGFYNYQYVTVDENTQLNKHEISGSFYQTENEYSVLVYYHKFGSRYDSVIGYGQGNSENIQN